MITLRDYQQKAVAEIQQAFRQRTRRVVLVMPTGAGKTTVFSHIGERVAARGMRVVVLVHRQELVEQVSAALGAMDVAHGIIAAGYRPSEAPVQIASVQTLARRLNRDIRPFNLVITDECHHAVAGQWQAVLAHMPAAYSLGVTATPQRLDGRGLGSAFDTMVEGPTVAELTAAGHLVPARVFARPERLDLSGVKVRAGDYATGQLAELMSAGGLVGNAVAHYHRLANGRPAVAFCANINHSQLVASRFRDAGIAAAHVDGKTDPAERRRMIAALGTGQLQVLCNVDLVGEGVDVPVIGAVLLLRPTRSVARYLQSVGRALRPAIGKVDAIVLDHAGCTLEHGLPDEPRVWTLNDQPARRPTERTEARGDRLRQCQCCGAFEPPGTPTCTTCGASLRPCAAEIREHEAQLEVRRQQFAEKVRHTSYRRVIEWADTPEKLQFAARARGYHRGWVRRRLEELERRKHIGG